MNVLAIAAKTKKAYKQMLFASMGEHKNEAKTKMALLICQKLAGNGPAFCCAGNSDKSAEYRGEAQ